MRKIFTTGFTIIYMITLSLQPLTAYGASSAEFLTRIETEEVTFETPDLDTEGATPEENTSNQEKTQLDLTATSVILMEASTGNVIYEVNAHEILPPASVTKIMTLLLIFEAIADGKITLEEDVVVSEYAASMGGSQVYLEVGEKQTVDTMIKCITVSSANDACVAMAEHIAGNEEAFVQQMNDRAEELGMSNTNFINCNGLDADGHLTTAYDISLMSQEIMKNHPEIEEYTMIWMEDITHVTQKGTSEFGLSNTNKLVRIYEYTTGLKTGYTSLAKSCISATARKNDVDLITVVMGAPSSTDRNLDAIKLLDYGFANCQRYTDNDKIKLQDVTLNGGISDSVNGIITEPFTYVDTQGRDLKSIEKKIVYMEDLRAPILEGDMIGSVEYYMGDELVGTTDILASESVDEMNFSHAFCQVIDAFTM